MEVLHGKRDAMQAVVERQEMGVRERILQQHTFVPMTSAETEVLTPEQLDALVQDQQVVVVDEQQLVVAVDERDEYQGILHVCIFMFTICIYNVHMFICRRV